LTAPAGVGDTPHARRGVSPAVAIVRTAGPPRPVAPAAVWRSGETFGHLVTAPIGTVEAVNGG